MRKGYSMIELVFVMVLIGSFAIPKMSSSVNLAHISTGKDILSSIRISLDTERHKRILKGDFSPILSLSSNKNGIIFDYFSSDRDGHKNPVLNYPIKSCSNIGCWEKINNLSLNHINEQYKYYYGRNQTEFCIFKLYKNKFVGNCPPLKSFYGD